MGHRICPSHMARPGAFLVPQKVCQLPPTPFLKNNEQGGLHYPNKSPISFQVQAEITRSKTLNPVKLHS